MDSFTDWLAEVAAAREAAGLRRAEVVRPDVSTVLDLAGNDYLGLARDPRVVASGVAALRTWGAGSTGSRLVTGTTALHHQLEVALAEFMGFDAALVLATGYAANLAAVTALSDADTLIVSDRAVHASTVDACRLARGRRVVVPHNDVAAVAAELAARSEPRALVLTESVFSVDGDAAPLAALHAVCREHGAVLVVDEAHGLGVLGSRGEGGCGAAGIAGEPDVVVTATLSKSLGSQGGVVLGSAAVREQVYQSARTAIFDTALAPAAAGGALGALQLLAADPGLVSRLRERSADLVAALAAAGLGAVQPAGAVVSVVLGDATRAVEAAALCLRHGVRVGCFRPPSVPAGTSRLRLTARPDLSDADLALVAGALQGVARAAAPLAAGERHPADPAAPGQVSGASSAHEGRVVLVTGTNTGVGKTVASAALCAAALRGGLRVAYLKVAQTGVPGDEPDVDAVARLTGGGLTLAEGMRFGPAMSPEAAARAEGRDGPALAASAARVRELAAGHDLVVVEGAGGLLVRFAADGWGLVDLARALGAPVVVVAGLALGTLNAAALTLEVAATRGIPVTGVVASGTTATPTGLETSNVHDLAALAGGALLGALPAGAGALAPEAFADLAAATFGAWAATLPRRGTAT